MQSALENCAAIPQMPDAKGIVSPQIRVHPDRWADIPFKIIVAYDAIDKDTLHKHIREYYQRNPQIPFERRPNFIHVLGKYMIARIRPDMRILESDGTPIAEKIDEGEFRWFATDTDASALAWTLGDIQQNAFFMSHSMFKYDSWINNMAVRSLNVG